MIVIVTRTIACYAVKRGDEVPPDWFRIHVWHIKLRRHLGAVRYQELQNMCICTSACGRLVRPSWG